MKAAFRLHKQDLSLRPVWHQKTVAFISGGHRTVEAILAELETLLYGYNYQVFLRAYRVPFAPGEPAESYVSRALGPSAVVAESKPVTGAEIVAEVEESLRYIGDENCGPEPTEMRSPRFNSLVLALLAALERAIADANLLATFRLSDGHPAYPVYWDFAFVVAGPSGGLVFIGSSSD